MRRNSTRGFTEIHAREISREGTCSNREQYAYMEKTDKHNIMNDILNIQQRKTTVRILNYIHKEEMSKI